MNTVVPIAPDMNLLDLFGGAGGSEEVRAVATALAGLERNLHDAVQDHYEALGVDPPADRQPREQRIEELCRLVEAHLDDDLWGFYVAEQAPESLENADAGREHAGKSEEEWAATVARWAEAAPDAEDGAAANASERERADRIARRRFGVDLETFERSVVEWSRERTLKNALRAPIDADVRRIRLATEVIEEVQE
jgi:head-tail adaptor